MLLDFDTHATTPLDPRVLEVMLPFFSEQFGNPSSISHRRGLAAAAVELRAREQVAELLGGDPRGIVWTSGATEANNLALKGILQGATDRRGLVTVATEHRSILDPAQRLSRAGHAVTILPVDSWGHLPLDQLDQAITKATTLVSVMWANNEIGTISPMSEISDICRRKGVWLHSDATQAIRQLPVRIDSSGVDLLSLSSHKLYGPPGIGALVIRRDRERIACIPQIDGGGQQFGIRSGTVPLALIVGLSQALRLCVEERIASTETLTRLRDQLWSELARRIPGIVRYGDPLHGLPHNLSVGLPHLDGDALLVRLQRSDLCVSSGAACSSTHREPSHVLAAIGIPDRLARASVRFGLSRTTTSDEVSRAAAILTRIASELQTP